MKDSDWTEEEKYGLDLNGGIDWRTRETTVDKIQCLYDNYPNDWWYQTELNERRVILDAVLARVSAMEEALGVEKVKEIYLKCQ